MRITCCMCWVHPATDITFFLNLKQQNYNKSSDIIQMNKNPFLMQIMVLYFEIIIQKKK